MADDHAYAPLDFSSIIGEKFAVHCATEEDAKHFCSEIRRQFGKEFRFRNGSKTISTHWDSYKEFTAYSPYLHNDSERMTYCNVEHYIHYGYTVVPFCDLVCIPELDEFEVDEFDIGNLFM